ncbi:MAG: hypothetical protein Kow0032_03910 [Methyloligellaceae bacterium]
MPLSPRLRAAVLPAALAIAGTLALPVSAAEQAAGRYAMTAVKDGVIRLDMHTGFLTFCRAHDTSWQCEPVSDPTAGLIAQCDALKARNAELAAQVKALRQELAQQGEEQRRARESATRSDQPGRSSAGPVAEMRAVLERMIRRFRRAMESYAEG